ncbi:hypothetical protein WH50_04195 [Pokkaliibacter plantistimulans]|uniref:SCP2 domain-containing protein n=1 Tax=Pokkaliibacter plantistimulans TaxID=1635171 RepID=A0ABX5M1X2_9GAMM|nr:hypothetical protein [Pokkaliibacter plantistimulans]PXF32491.1 hypothetical protein WH50_04195 [Pokkaliibacter plantistimulans]
MELSSPELKVAVGKFISIAYSKDKGLTTQLLLSGGASITVDEQGHAKLSGKAGILVFNGSPVLENIGANIKTINISFSNEEDMKIGYTLTLNMKFGRMKVKGDFDLDEMITSCSGLLCRAAKALKFRHASYDAELKRILGN